MIHHLTDQDHLNIARAARQYGVDAGLIAAIWQDELSRLDIFDHLQNTVAVSLCRLPDPLKHALRRLTETVTRRSLATHSVGPAQMKPGTLQDVARSGLLTIPESLCDQIAFLLERQHAPLVIAARLRQTINHWAHGHVNLTRRPDILGTLYSIGLTGQQGVHPNPQPNARGLSIAAAASEYLPPVRVSFTSSFQV